MKLSFVMYKYKLIDFKKSFFKENVNKKRNFIIIEIFYFEEKEIIWLW